MRLVVLAAIILFGPAFVFTAEAQDLPSAEVETIDLGGGVHALITNRAGNVGALIGEDGVLMIDTQMAPLAPALDEAQREVSSRNVDIVVNTHLHGDHVLGNAYFAEKGAVVLAHPSVRPALENPVTSQLTGRTPEPLSGAFLPAIDLMDQTKIHMNGETVHFFHEPNAHTGGDIWVFFENANVIHAGDLLFSGVYPYIDLDNGGSVKGMMWAMESIANLANEDTKIIAGHGPMSTKADLEASIEMLAEGRRRISALLDEGMTLEDIQAAAPLADYDADWDWRFITSERMVWTHYRDLTGKTE
ncbi:MAG: MBL fold metallo-hydrolase [Pseudomonadota bacterium]